MRTLRIYSLTFLCDMQRVNDVYPVVHFIPGTYSSYNWESVLFNHLPPAGGGVPPPAASGNRDADLFFCEFLRRLVWEV